MSRIDEYDGPPPRRRSRSWLLRKRWLVLLALVALGWFAPQIVAMTPLRQMAVDAALPADLKGKVEVRSASLGWFSPVALGQIVWHDAEGRTLVEMPQLRMERTLAQLISSSSSLGTIHLQQPRVSIALRDNGSNLEDALAPLLKAPRSDKPLELNLEIEQGIVELVDVAREQSWQIEKLDGTVALVTAVDQPSQVKIAGQIHDAQGIARPLQATYAWHAPREKPAADAPGKSLVLKATATPLEMFRPIVRRFMPDAQLQGTLSCDVQWSVNADGTRQQLILAELQGDQLLFAAPSALGKDAIRTTKLTASGEIESLGDKIKFTSLKLDSDSARLTAEGYLPSSGWNGANLSSTLLAALQNDDYQLHGEVDLAQIAAMLPQTLRIRQGTEITKGVVTLDLTSSLHDRKRRWDGELKSSQIVAKQNGREIAWDQPVTITLAAQQSTAGPVIERLAVASSFFDLQARGTLETGELSAKGDLAQLLAEASRFVDLDDTKLAGKLDGGLAWRRGNENKFDAEGQVLVTEFVLASPGRPAWQEPQLTLDFIASGRGDAQAWTHLDTATARLVAGKDQLEAKLASAIERPATNTTWPLLVSAQGELATWLPRVSPWLTAPIDKAAGQIDLQAQVVSSPTALQVQKMKVDLADLRVQTPSVLLSEPEVHFTGDATLTYATGQITSQTISLMTSAVACRGDQLLIVPQGSGTALSGELSYRANLARLSQWFVPVGTSPQQQWQGESIGRVVFTHQGNVTQAKWTVEMNKLAVARQRERVASITPLAANAAESWETIWAEEKLVGQGDGEFDHTRDRLTAKHLLVTSDMLNLSATGNIDALSTKPSVDLKGELACDLAKVGQLLESYLGEGLKLEGTDKREFVLRGPLPTWQTVASADARQPAQLQLTWPKELVGRGGVGWKSAEAYGLSIGEANVDAALENGIVSITPLDLKVADGRVKAWPRIVLANDPMVFQLAKGTQVEQVQITPSMCRSWLKYVAPLLADATKAEGKFSLAVEGATIPLLAPEAGDASGVMKIHGARVGPGPLAEQYVMLASQVRSVLERRPLDANFRADDVKFLTLPEHDVQVEMNSGRVYHKGLQIMVRDTTLVTSGSVGVDQSLSLIVEIPIRDEWIAKDRLLSALRGQTLKVPIGGTVGKPQFDTSVFKQLAGQMARGAVENILENKVQQGLDRIFKPK